MSGGIERLIVWAGPFREQFVGNGAKMVGHGHEVFDPVEKAQFAQSIGLLQPDADVIVPGVVNESADIERAFVTEIDGLHAAVSVRRLVDSSSDSMPDRPHDETFA